MSSKPAFGADDILTWLNEQPDDREFICADETQCLVAQYLADFGYDQPVVLGTAFRHGAGYPIKCWPLPSGISHLIFRFDLLDEEGATLTAAQLREHLCPAP